MMNHSGAFTAWLVLLAASCSGRDGGAETPTHGLDSGPDTHDADGDGSMDAIWGGDDCNDADPEVYPGAPDTVGDGVDQDCDGGDGVDADRDGHASAESGGDDCDDTNLLIHPGVVDVGWVGWTYWGNGRGAGGCWNYAGVSLATGADGSIHLAYYCWAGDGTDEPVMHGVVSRDEPLAAPTREVVADDMFDFRGILAPLDMAVDAAGTAWFAWVADVHQGPQGLYYGGASAAELIDRGAGSATDIALALGDDDAPHLAYADYDSVTYATPLGDDWFVQGIATADGPAGSVAITLDGAGAVEMLYRTQSGVGWSQLAEGWTHERVASDPLASTRDRVALATAPDGVVHGAWAAADGFVHATLEDDAWRLETVDADGGRQPSIAVGADGTVLVAHLSSDDSLMLSTGAAGTWSTELVASAGEHESSRAATAIALSHDAEPTVAFWYGGEYGSLGVYWRRLPDGVDDDCSGVVDDERER